MHSIYSKYSYVIIYGRKNECLPSFHSLNCVDKNAHYGRKY